MNPVGIYVHFHRTDSLPIAFQIGDFLLQGDLQLVQSNYRVLDNLFLTFRDKGSAFIKGHQLTVKIAGIFCILAFERSRKEIVYIENTIHEFAKRFRIIKPALFPFLNLSEYRAADAQGGIFYRFVGGKLFLTLLFDSRYKLPTFFARKKAV